MARRRKSDAKPSTKSPLQRSTAVRKSSRQIAKKQQQQQQQQHHHHHHQQQQQQQQEQEQEQQEEKKINGETAPSTRSTDFQESGACRDDHNQLSTKKIHTVHKKFGKYKCAYTNDAGETEAPTIVRYKGDGGESDSQEGAEVTLDSSDKLSPEAVRKVVGISDSVNDLANETGSSEIVWQEDVIEETIICEEMEVEEDGSRDTYTIERDGNSVVLEQVLLVDQPDYEGKDVVEFTVIQNEDGTESMIVASDEAALAEIEYDEKVGSSLRELTPVAKDEESSENLTIEKGIGDLRVAEPSEISSASREKKSYTPPIREENFKSSIDSGSEKERKSDILTKNDRRRKSRAIRNDQGRTSGQRKPRRDKSDEAALRSDQALKNNTAAQPSPRCVPPDIQKEGAVAVVSTVIVTASTTIPTTAHIEYLRKENPLTVRRSDERENRRCYSNKVNKETRRSVRSSRFSEASVDDVSSINRNMATVKINEDPKEADASGNASTAKDLQPDCVSRAFAEMTTSSSSPSSSSSSPSSSSSSSLSSSSSSSSPLSTSSLSLSSSLGALTAAHKSRDPNLNDDSTTLKSWHEFNKDNFRDIAAPENSISLVDPVSDLKTSSTAQFLSQSKVVCDAKSAEGSKHTDYPKMIEELSRDSDIDGKGDAEDAKLSSSSSENSNDTSLTLSGNKIPELNAKSIGGQQIEADKKVVFRSRSGSTDTTGSESGSNSSGVRRSSRIRSIGLMKQRSRGRGLVTKPNLDLSRTIFQQERDKASVGASMSSLDSKDNSDNQSETQSDRESAFNKTATSLDSSASQALAVGTTGYDSDSLKPVKVKSRWRRSSELEMGRSGSGFAGASGSGSRSGLTAASRSKVGLVSGFELGSSSAKSRTNLEDDPPGDAPSAVTSCYGGALTPPRTEIAESNSSLLIVTEARDKEMEERLSQFDQLKENLYLTERYTNKETKRMVCDCFLTEEEIARGELGCGEDCLNRLLMIECGPRCVVGDRCTNKRFQNCEYAKCEVFRTEKKGFGLRATVDLYAGEFIMEYVGEVVDPKDFRRRAKEYSKDKNIHYYFMALKSDQIIDATLKGNVSRFINHSCDPNSETQKWTVNGELRIGFFNKKFIAAGDEITFDYHFQRYGKEAQKCFCEAPNCRGWIGDTPEEEQEKIEKKEQRQAEKDGKKKEEEKKPADYMEDEDLEEEIDKLCVGGLKNRAHTLMLSRLMVRSRELEHRTRLLRVIQSGEQPCRRLFLDYHGLRLIWSYMMDIAMEETDEARQFRLEILKTLGTLPIPNKTMLMDSKVYSVVDKWAKHLYVSPNGGSPEDEQQAKQKISSEEPDSSCDSNEKSSIERLSGDNVKAQNTAVDVVTVDDVKSEATTDQMYISELASNLLVQWSSLKEVFRIPKKERIEQMKEHEREADRGYKEDLEKEDERETSSYDRYRSDRYGRSDIDKRSDRRRGRESPDSEYSRPKDKRLDERSNLVPIPRMSKFERRQLFALKVAKEEEERQRRQQQETWQEHEARCMALGMDPHTTATLDPTTGYPLFFNASLGQWQSCPTQDGEIAQQCSTVYMSDPQLLQGLTQSGVMSVNPLAIPPGVSPVIPSSIPAGVSSSVYSLNQTTAYNSPNTAYHLYPNQQQFSDGQLQMSGNLISVHNGTPPLAVQSQQQLYAEKSAEEQFSVTATTESLAAPQTAVVTPPLDLPPKWKWAKDNRGRIYYYHSKLRVSQWLPPPPDHIGVQPDSSSSSETSEESSSSDENEEDPGEGPSSKDGIGESMEVEADPVETPSSNSRDGAARKAGLAVNSGNYSVSIAEPKRRRDGLVQERIISPRREDDRSDHKKHKDIKEKIRRQKERAKLKEQVEKIKRHRRSNKSKSHSRHSSSKSQSISSEISPTSERKIKDMFRINMANVMVHFLNPYRKNDCKQGRITNTEDFKHLARKLTHFVLAKELKHCKSVDELQCNENVKHKAKDFVRKYMSKFGAVYQKATDDD